MAVLFLLLMLEQDYKKRWKIIMRKLKFTAQCSEGKANRCQTAQQYVTNLLSDKLGQYGFIAEIDEAREKIAINVQDHPVALGVSCETTDITGALLCEINAYADETQDWFQKIETQSVIKQLAQAVEETLKKDTSLKDFEWKTGD